MQIHYRTKNSPSGMVATSSLLKCLCLANNAGCCLMGVCSEQKEQRDEVCR